MQPTLNSSTAPEPRARATTESPFIDVAGDTKRGADRRVNEDAFLTLDLHRDAVLGDSSLALRRGASLSRIHLSRLLAVADGEGGRGGQVCSARALQTLGRHAAAAMPWARRVDDDVADAVARELERGFERCQDRIDAPGPGDVPRPTVSLTAMVIAWPYAVVAHAGNARAYLYRGRTLRQVTEDHTLAGEMERHGVPGADDEADIVTNAVGGHDDVEVLLRHFRLRPGDQLLAATDGLVAACNELVIARAMQRGATAAGVCRRLLEADVDDDATAVVARIASGGDA